MIKALTLLASVASVILPIPAAAQDHALVLTGVGRFAYFADVASITPDSEGLRMRSLQVNEEDFVISGVSYPGGWSWWHFDCAGQTADRLDYASLRADGTEGPTTPIHAPPFEIAPGGDAAELAAIACAANPPAADAASLDDAIRLARAQMQN